MRIYKACPFCGSFNLKDCYVYIKCLDCLTEGPATNKKLNDDHADSFDNQRAFELWNKRAKKIRPK